MKTNLQNNFQKLIGYKIGRFIPSTYKFKVNKKLQFYKLPFLELLFI